MTLNQLEYFQKVATLQHFRQAAELLKISQPSLSGPCRFWKKNLD